MYEAPSTALPPGRRIAEYEIVRVLGAGGFGITYLAFDHQLDGPVAIKEYFPADVATRVGGATVEATSPSNRETFAWGFERFMAEARAIHRFRHPNVVRAHRYLEENGTAYIVMEYVEGESLKAILDRRGTLPAEEWRPWLDALADGLAGGYSSTATRGLHAPAAEIRWRPPAGAPSSRSTTVPWRHVCEPDSVYASRSCWGASAGPALTRITCTWSSRVPRVSSH